MHDLYLYADAESPDTIVGLWCDTCLRPSRMMVPYVILDDHGVQSGPGQLIDTCIDCDEFEDEEGDDDGNHLVRD